MSLTRERKILFVVLAIGAVALLTDRILLSGGSAGPNDAAASELVPLPAPQRAELARSASAESTSRPSMTESTSIADALEAVASQRSEPGSPRDAFVLVGAWALDSQSALKAPKIGRLEQFVENHQLGAVMGNGQEGVAIIDGQPVRVGNSFEGYTLINVDTRSAVFRSEFGTAVLKLKRH